MSAHGSLMGFHCVDGQHSFTDSPKVAWFLFGSLFVWFEGPSAAIVPVYGEGVWPLVFEKRTSETRVAVSNTGAIGGRYGAQAHAIVTSVIGTARFSAMRNVSALATPLEKGDLVCNRNA
jgi:hypothetical protein